MNIHLPVYYPSQIRPTAVHTLTIYRFVHQPSTHNPCTAIWDLVNRPQDYFVKFFAFVVKVSYRDQLLISLSDLSIAQGYIIKYGGCFQLLLRSKVAGNLLFHVNTCTNMYLHVHHWPRFCYVMFCYVILGIATAEVLSITLHQLFRSYTRATLIAIVAEESYV